MAKRKTTEDKLETLRGLSTAPLTGDGEKLLREAIGSRNRELVTQAAGIVRESGLEGCCGALAEAFAHFVENPKKDKGCIAKCALVEALDSLEYEDDEIFFAGLRHIQKEPVWGGQEDTGAGLRAKCAIALARRNLPGVLFHLADLLSDPEAESRRGAIRAITYAGGNEAELILRVMAGQSSNQADISESLGGLMECNPERSLPFVARFLDHAEPGVAESAALAMGSSRQPEALEILVRRWEQTVTPQVRDILLLPIALIRSEEALHFLLELLREGHIASAEAALEALAIFRDDDRARSAIGAAVEERDERSLKDAWARLCGEY